jgi:hypothetical protein
MRSITIIATVVMLGLLQGLAFASDYAPKQNDRINLYKVTSENENAPMYSGYYRDSEGTVHRVAVWSGTSDNYLEGSVTIPTSE